MPSEIRDHPVFICGHPKSGTSLLRSLLDSHPQLVVYPEESVFFRRYRQRTAGLSLTEKLNAAERYLLHIFTWNQENPLESQAGFPDRDYSAIPYDAVQDAFREIALPESIRHDGDILAAAVLAFGRVTGQWTDAARHWVEKSPYNEQFAAQIFAWWPEAKCIHVVRDPQDNHVSYRRKHPDWQPEFFAHNWRRSTQQGFANRQRYGDARYWLLRFEDLLRNPEETLEILCRFLAIDSAPELSQPSRAGETWAGNSMFGQRFDSISQKPIGRWRESLEAPDAAVIETIDGALMEKLSYPLVSGRPLAARWRALTWPLRQRWAAIKKRK